MIVLFAGPSLPDAATRAADMTVLPPAGQGDVYRAVRDLQPHAVGLVDGVFLDAAAVWHREILWALSQGVHVAGAASMGALRAAELDGFGMRGVGRIYEAYRDGVLEADDEVAVEHAPAALGWAPLSTALVDLRATLDAAVEAGAADAATCARLTALMTALPFARRSRVALAHAAGTDLGAWLDTHPVERKRLDAEALLDALRTLPAERFRPDFAFTRALVWDRFVHDQRRVPIPAVARLAALAGTDPRRWRRLRRLAAARVAALAALPAAPPAAARTVFDAFRIEHGLVRLEDIRAWLGYHGVDAETLSHLMQDEATLDAAADSPALQAAMADLLVLADDAP